MTNLWQDLRYGARMLWKNPGLTSIAVATLALGIGANTAIFSFMDKLLLESLPVERPRELVMLRPDGIRNGWVAGRMTWSYLAYAGIRERQQVFTGVLAERTDSVNLTIDGVTERATESIVSGNYFEVLGVRPLLGRVLSAEDDRIQGGHPVAVLSHGFWVERLGGRPEIVGQTIRLNGHPFTGIGVSEKGFNGLEVGGSVDAFVPVTMLRQAATYGGALDSRSSYIFQVYGRLKPGISRAVAVAQMQPVYLAELEQDVAAMGARGPSDDRWREGRLILEDGHRGTSGLRGDLETPLTALMAMTGVVLLIACANIAGLLMARAAYRTREISIRMAIGASRGRVVRQLFTESAMLAALGGLASLFVASWTINLLVAEMGESAERFRLVTNFLDARVLGFAFAASAATGILFGLLPALNASRESVSSGLKTGVAADRKGQMRLRRMLVIAQVALGLVLITASGLFLRTLQNLRYTDTGFRTDHLIQFQLNSGAAGYDSDRSKVLFRQILEELRSVPGVSNATLALSSMLSNARISFGLEVEGYTHSEAENSSSVCNAVAPGYFAMLGTPLLRGRDFNEADTATSQRVTIVNETFVRKYFPDRDPLGRKIRLSWGMAQLYDYEIIGVSKDARFANLRDLPERNFFMPYTQWDYLGNTYFYARTPGDSALLAGPIRELVKRHDANIPVVEYRTVDEQIDQLLRPERLVASLSLAFGLLATGLAAIGLYGVTAFSVARRTHEIGIRMALGAQRAVILRMVLRDVAAMAIVGIVMGVALSLGLTRYVEAQLYGVPARDIMTIGAAAIVLAVAALAAGWLPARRASRVDPMIALRQE
jgi:putative ABC transport system permease protein